ncbi:MAG TPA: DUF2179 domain-containing protein [Candidatus Hydrogenedentes bacterium]|nr:DUF2179 domain-containing protein [Candidatus Hydrogenedentota bacterium]
MTFFQENIHWLLPILIFCARVLDVSIGTLRIISLSRGLKLLAPACGFFEVLIWIAVMGAVMNSINSWVNYLAFAGGFAMGNYVGMLIEDKLAMGIQSLWVVMKEDKSDLLSHMRAARFGVTMFEAQGVEGSVRIMMMIIRRKNLRAIMQLLREHVPRAFISVQDIRAVSGGVFPVKMARYTHPPMIERPGK